MTCQIKRFKKNESKSKRILTVFLNNSSVYAFNRIGNSSKTSRKVFWGIVFIVSTVGCIFETEQYLSPYYKYPVYVSLESINSAEVEFPSVTICNLNAFRKIYQPCLKNKSIDGCSADNVQRSSKKSPPKERKWLCDYPESNNFYTDSGDWIKAVNYKTRIKYGHQFENFIVHCNFGGGSCSEFKVTNTPDYGNCYSFNPNGDISIQSAGPNSGLELELDIELDEYAVSHYEGARVQVHDPFVPPDINLNSVTVSPGFEHYIAISKSVISRLPAPYKDRCRKYDRGDSPELCEERCRDEVVRRLCYCSQSRYYNDSEFQLCDHTDFSVICCLDYVNKLVFSCDCPLACHDVHYDFLISSAVWPSKVHYDENQYELALRELKNPKNNISYEHLRKSRLRVKVFYETLDYMKFTQHPCHESSEFLSQIGGQMSLWLSLSLISIFELFESILLSFSSEGTK